MILLALLATVGLLQLGSPPALQFNGGAQSRGILTWDPLGDGTQSASCIGTPSSCYPTTGLPSAQLAVLKAANIGHIRIGVEVGPMLSDTANVNSVYLPAIFQSVGVFASAGFKVVVTFSATGVYSGVTSNTIFSGGPSSANFLAYVAMLKSVANYVKANPGVCPPATCMLETYNETPNANAVTGGVNAQYSQLKAMFQAYRQILPKHTIVLCLTNYCNVSNLVGFGSWNAADFDANTMIAIHPYLPYQTGGACQAGSDYRDLCSPVLAYPPAKSSSDSTAAIASYETQLAADNTWAGDCPAGSNCVAARAANKTEIECTVCTDSIPCYYGQGCTNAQQDGTWIALQYAGLLSWLPAGVTAKQIYAGEFGTPGVTATGTGLGTTGQTNLFADQSAALNAAGFSWCVIGVNYDINFAVFGLQNPGAPYAFINPPAITALGFNGQ